MKNLPLYTDRTTAIFEDAEGAKGLAVGLPVTLLLDRNGCSLGHINGPAEWDSAEATEADPGGDQGERGAAKLAIRRDGVPAVPFSRGAK